MGNVLKNRESERRRGERERKKEQREERGEREKIFCSFSQQNFDAHFSHCSDNDFEYLSPEIRHLTGLRILAVRDNELIELPQEIGELQNLRELHVQGNRLTVLPPQIGYLDFLSSR